MLNFTRRELRKKRNQQTNLSFIASYFEQQNSLSKFRFSFPFHSDWEISAKNKKTTKTTLYSCCCCCCCWWRQRHLRHLLELYCIVLERNVCVMRMKKQANTFFPFPLSLCNVKSLFWLLTSLLDWRNVYWSALEINIFTMEISQLIWTFFKMRNGEIERLRKRHSAQVKGEKILNKGRLKLEEGFVYFS